MQLVNATKMVAGYTLGLKPDGRETVVVVVKGTYRLPLDGGSPELAEEQQPLIMADEYSGDPGLSAPLRESDFAPEKPKCDVLLLGSAYAPGGRPRQRVTVSLRVGALSKSFDVVGDRAFDKGLLAVAPRPYKPFRSMSISYDRAYGGVDADKNKPDKIKAYASNPIGVGYYPCTKSADLVGKPLPNTEETGKPIKSANGSYRPMSFGPIGRNFDSRVPLAGTYDQAWIDDVFPFLPADFDPRYYQAAPADQQIDPPRGGEPVELINLSPREHLVFQLPAVDVPVEFTDEDATRVEGQARLDTIVIEPDAERFVLVWRAAAPLKRGLPSMKQCVVGRMPRGWYRARQFGKTYYPDLRRLADARGENE